MLTILWNQAPNVGVGGVDGFDPYIYKPRDGKKRDREEVEEFLSDVLGWPVEAAPEPVKAEIEAATKAAEKVVATDQVRDRAVLDAALKQIDSLYALIEAEAMRLREMEEDDEEALLLLH